MRPAASVWATPKDWGVSPGLTGSDDRVREALWLGLHYIGDGHAPFGAVAHRLLHLLPCLGRDDYADLLYAHGRDVVEHVSEYRPVRYRHELLRAGVGKRP